MWKAAIKLAMLYMLRNRFSEAKTRIKGDLYKIKDSFANLIESRTLIFKNNLNNELDRIFHSLVGLMLILAAIISSSVTAIIWLTITALTSPHRNLIFTTAMILPLIIALIIYWLIRRSWAQKPLFHHSIVQIKKDWQLFRQAGESETDISMTESTDVTTQ